MISKKFLTDLEIDRISHALEDGISSLARVMGVNQHQIEPVKKLSQIKKSEFGTYFLKYPGIPCVVSDAMTHWPAMQWDFQNLKDRFGNIEIMVQPSLREKENKYTVQFRDYIEYVLGKKNASDLLQVGETTIPSSERLYGLAFHPFSTHPDLFNEFDECPYFVEDYFSGLIGERFRTAMRAFRHHWLFIGPKGSLSQFHSDHHDVMTYLAQIKGRKLVLLVSPNETEKITSPEGPLNPFSICMHTFKSYKEVTFFAAVLEPGQMLFLPRGWNHYVLGLTPSITLSKDIVNIFNFGEYFLNLFVRDLPYLATKLNHLPAHVKKQIGINWKIRD